MGVFADISQAVGAAAVTGALLVAAWQTRSLRAQVRLQRSAAESSNRSLLHQLEQSTSAEQALRASNDLRLMTALLDIDRVFVDRPELRRFIHDAHALPPGGIERDQVLAVGELIADFAEAVVTMVEHDQIDSVEQLTWKRAIGAYGRSPAVRHVIDEEPSIYNPRTIEWLRQRQSPEESAR